MGCGRTVRLYLASDIPRRHYGTNALFLFLSALIAGATVSGLVARCDLFEIYLNGCIISLSMVNKRNYFNQIKC